MSGLLKNRLSDEEEYTEINMPGEEPEAGEEDFRAKRRRERKTPPDEEEYSDYGYERKRVRISEEDIGELSELDSITDGEEQEKRERTKAARKKAFMVVMAFVCAYLVLLIYGTLVTDFSYGEKGLIEPVIMSVEDIENRNEFLEMEGYYLQTRSLYEEILTLDYRVSSQVEELIGIATEYEAMIEKINALVVQIEATDIGQKYNQVLSLMHTLVNRDFFNYCTYMSKAITQNDDTAADEAISARPVVESGFRQLTENVITLGSAIKGVDVSDLTEWSPQGYIDQNIIGLTPGKE